MSVPVEQNSRVSSAINYLASFIPFTTKTPNALGNVDTMISAAEQRVNAEEEQRRKEQENSGFFVTVQKMISTPFNFCLSLLGKIGDYFASFFSKSKENNQ